eukprot:785462_1
MKLCHIVRIVILALFLTHFYPRFYRTEQVGVMASNLRKRKNHNHASPSGGQNPRKKPKVVHNPFTIARGLTPIKIVTNKRKKSRKSAPKPSPRVHAYKPQDVEEKKDEEVTTATPNTKAKKSRNRLNDALKQVKIDELN